MALLVLNIRQRDGPGFVQLLSTHGSHYVNESGPLGTMGPLLASAVLFDRVDIAQTEYSS